MNQAAQQSPETGPSPGSVSAPAEQAVPAIAVLLAACAGATDALAFFGLGKAFGTSLRQLGALLAGAILSGVVLHALRPAAPAVPLLLLAAATTVELLRRSR